MCPITLSPAKYSYAHDVEAARDVLIEHPKNKTKKKSRGVKFREAGGDILAPRARGLV